MYATERHESIAEALRSDGRVSVSDLALRLDVTAETVRRDLDALEQSGLLQRVHGGAVAAELARWTPATPGTVLTVITNAVPIAALLQHSATVDLHLLGGRVRGLTSAAVGTSTVEQIQALRPDIVFVGANGLSAGFGLSTPDEFEGAVKSART